MAPNENRKRSVCCDANVCPDESPPKRQARQENRLPGRSPEAWRQQVDETYPKLLAKTYFLPSAHMNHVQYDQMDIAGMTVAIPQQPVRDQRKGDPKVLQESQFRADRTQQNVLRCLQKFAAWRPQEVMFVISQLDFKNYLGNPSQAAEASKFRRPRDFPADKLRRGDFDLVVIHRRFGLLVFEIKAVGEVRDTMSQPEQAAKIVEKVDRAGKQLDKAGQVLDWLLSDMPSRPQVTKLLMLPNVAREELGKALAGNPKVVEDLRKLLSIPDAARTVDFILCAEHLLDKKKPGEVTADAVKELAQWWDRLTSQVGQDPAMTDDLYKELVARFGGPATNVTVCSEAGEPPKQLLTEGQAVSETGNRFSRHRLHEQQARVLEDNRPCVFLCGPPGTGKTLTLELRARKWLLQNSSVDIVSTWSGSLAASHLIQHDLLAAGFPGPRVRMREFELKEPGGVGLAVDTLLRNARQEGQGRLCVIVDEAFCGSQFVEFCTRLHNNVDLHLWGASVYHGFTPDCLHFSPLSAPLRTPPVITRQVRKSSLITGGFVLGYREPAAPQPTDGPQVKRIRHNSAPLHSPGWAGDCPQCGFEVARVLQELSVGQPVSQATPLSCPAPLRYRDVFLLTTIYELVDEERDEEGDVTQAASGLLHGLGNSGVPFRVVRRGDSEALREVATGSGPDAVVVADADSIRGLERKVVVWVPYDKKADMWGEVGFARLDAMSRATAQLVVIA